MLRITVYSIFFSSPLSFSPSLCSPSLRLRERAREINERLAATAAASDILMRTSRSQLGLGLRLLFYFHQPQPHYYSYSLISPLSQPYSSSSSSSIYSHLLRKQQQQQDPEQSSCSVGSSQTRVSKDYEPSLLFHKKSYRDFSSSSSRVETPPPLIPFVRSQFSHSLYFV